MPIHLDPWWEVLAVLPTATDDEIKAAYRLAAQRAHPDRGGSHERMVAVNTAYDAAQRRHLSPAPRRRAPPTTWTRGRRAGTRPPPQPAPREPVRPVVARAAPGTKTTGLPDVEADLFGGFGVRLGMRVDEHGKIRLQVGVTSAAKRDAEKQDGDDLAELVKWLI